MTLEHQTRPTDPAPLHPVPRGVGLYLSRVAREWSASQRVAHAHRARLARISHVGLCSEALDGWAAPHDALRSAADAYRELGGVSASVYALPGRRRAVTDPVGVAHALLEAAEAVGAAHAILDAEESYRGAPAALRTTLDVLLASGRTIGVTTYGSPSSDARRVRVRPQTGGPYPWAELVRAHWIGHQVYEQAAEDERVERALDELRELMGHPGLVVPHVATYPRQGPSTPQEGLDGALRLRGDLERACLDDRGAVSVPGVWLWQDASLDDEECRVVADFAQRVGWR